MTFDAIESSDEGGAPVTLFKFTHGTQSYLYTNHTREITHDSLTYTPVTIKPGKLTSSGDMSKNQLKIDIDWSTELAQLMRGIPPSKEIAVVLMDGHLSDPDNEYIVSWSGLVLGSSRTASKVTLTCDSVTAAIRGLGLSRDWMLTCPYVLYDEYCAASEVAATTVTAPLSVVGNVLTLPVGWRGATDISKYLHGMVRWTGGRGSEVRRIISVDAGEVIKIRGAIVDIAVGQTIDVMLGCNRQIDDCDTLHSDIVNFGGQPNIPTDNPTNQNDF